jgi:hypothetical protein
MSLMPPRIQNTSCAASPTTWYAIATSPLRAYSTSGICTTESSHAAAGSVFAATVAQRAATGSRTGMTTASASITCSSGIPSTVRKMREDRSVDGRQNARLDRHWRSFGVLHEVVRARRRPLNSEGSPGRSGVFRRRSHVARARLPGVRRLRR